jgi:hypothetical protein
MKDLPRIIAESTAPGRFVRIGAPLRLARE